VALAPESEENGLVEYWPDDVGERFRPAQFRATLDAALTEIRDPDQVDLVKVDCREPPCIAILRNRRPDGRMAGIQTTDAWEEAYGAAIVFAGSGVGGRVDCGDGRYEEVEVVVPPYDLEKQTDDEDELPWEIRQADENRWRRAAARWREIEASWMCRGQ
jgi:hypothetical protein